MVTLLLSALLVVPRMLAQGVNIMWAAVVLVSVAASVHQGWLANFFTTVSDVFPRCVVASVWGIGGLASASGAFVFQRATGAILETTQGNYAPIFVVLGLAYVAALLLIHVLVPRLEPIAVIPPMFP